MTKLKIETNDWQKIENLTNGTTYMLQSKIGKDCYEVSKILFTTSTNVPQDLDDGFWDSQFKFKKGTEDVYIRAIKIPVTLKILEVN